LNPEGHIVVSGFMASQVKKILNAYSNSFTNLMEQTKSDWALISGKLI
jgi:ribosomal protein L11 methylase PrmA